MTSLARVSGHPVPDRRGQGGRACLGLSLGLCGASMGLQRERRLGRDQDWATVSPECRWRASYLTLSQCHAILVKMAAGLCLGLRVRGQGQSSFEAGILGLSTCIQSAVRGGKGALVRVIVHQGGVAVTTRTSTSQGWEKPCGHRRRHRPSLGLPSRRSVQSCLHTSGDRGLTTFQGGPPAFLGAPSVPMEAETVPMPTEVLSLCFPYHSCF